MQWRVGREIGILKHMKHPRINALHGVVDTPDRLFILLQVRGGPCCCPAAVALGVAELTVVTDHAATTNEPGASPSLQELSCVGLQFLPNGSLLDRVRKHKRIVEPEAARLLRQSAEGLQHCHEQHVRLPSAGPDI